MKQSKLVVALGAALAITLSGAAVAAKPDPNRMLVKFKTGASANVETALRGAGGKVHKRLDKQRAISVTLPPQALQGLRNRADIEYIEVDQPRYPMGQVTPYGINAVQAPATWAAGADGTGIKVCIIDSGINANHEDFAGISMTGYPSGWNSDSCGHGTHVAGTIAAANNSVGVVGVSPGKVSLHMVQVFSGETCAWSYASTLIDAANRCADAGAKIISMSLGGGGYSNTEKNTFASLDSQGILSIAAAGNDGNGTMSYPASYDSVMSVAAVDSNNVVASFSQYTSQVEIAAPGVGVLSTYPFRDAAMSVGSTGFIVSAMEGTVQATANGAMVDGGRCTSAGSWAGKVVLCERGDIAFADKVTNVTAGGGVASVTYNNAPGGFTGTLGGTSTIPAISMSQADGQGLVANSLGQTANVSSILETNTSGYAYLDGTSMATPHVSGAAAIIWSANPSATNQQVRNAMTSTALDLGAAGRDIYYGYGLVQTFDATEALLGGGGPGPDPVAAPAGLTAYNYGKSRGTTQIGLAWSGGAVTVDVYRDGSKIKSAISNAGSYTEAIKGKGGTLTYKVCNAGSSTCSANASVNY